MAALESRVHRKLVQACLAELGVDEDLTRCDVTPAVGPGDNLMGSVLRVSSHGVHLIVKIAHSNPAERDAYNSATLFRNETAFYKQVIPQLSSLLSSQQAPLAVPRCRRTFCDGHDDILVLEDLKPAGFRMADRIQGLNVPQCRLVLKELARLHALSFAMKSQQPERFTKLREYIEEALYCEQQRRSWEKVTAETFEDTANMIDEILQDKKYSTILRRHFSTGFDFFVEMVKGNEPWSVINHGDCWTNNLLFRYSQDGEPEQVKMLDFQISRYSSFALDVMFFLCTSVRPAILEVELENFISEYHERLVSTLHVLGESPPTFGAVSQELARCSTYGLAKAFVALPFFTRPPCDVTAANVSSTNVMEDLACNTRRKSHVCRHWLADVVRLFVDRGLVK